MHRVNCTTALLLIFVLCVFSADFDQCKRNAQSDRNAAESNTELAKYFYYGPLAHFSNKTSRPLVLTLEGCQHYCGNHPKINNLETALITLATWILPFVGLISQLPFESMHVGKAQNFWAFVAWIGTPASCLTATLFNLHATKMAADMSPDRDRTVVVDYYYVLSCLNQYEYFPLDEDGEEDDDIEPENHGRRSSSLHYKRGPTNPIRISSEHQNGGITATGARLNNGLIDIQKIIEDDLAGNFNRHRRLDVSKRTRALIYGLLRPHINEDDQSRDLFHLSSSNSSINPYWHTTSVTISQLAHQLRMLRRRAVWPFVASSIWFAISSGISIGVAFGNLGDNTTAHSLALGLLLSWLPIVVLASIVDRNPIASTRCRILLNRWLDMSYCLYRLETQEMMDQQVRNQGAMFRNEPIFPGNNEPASLSGGVQRHDPPGSHTNTERSANHHIFWDGGEKTIVELGDFVGQGRIPSYTGLIYAVLQAVQRYDKRIRRRDAGLVGKSEVEKIVWIAEVVRPLLWKRPLVYYKYMAVSFVIVYLGVFMAFIVSFNTPTVGLGCRSLMYILFATFSVVPLVVELFIALARGLYRRDSPVNRFRVRIFRFFGLLAATTLCLTAIAQLLNFFNFCTCKASIFQIGSAFGGYVDLENGEFYRDYFDVRRYWGAASGIGFASPLISAIFLVYTWRRTMRVWRVEEKYTTPRLPTDESPPIGLVPADWLR